MSTLRTGHSAITWPYQHTFTDSLATPVGSGSREGFHLPAPTEPRVTVSRHTALAVLVTRGYVTQAQCAR